MRVADENVGNELERAQTINSYVAKREQQATMATVDANTQLHSGLRLGIHILVKTYVVLFAR